MRGRNKNNIVSYVIIIIMLVLVGVGIYIYNSDSFEQNKPVVSIDDRVYWNMKDNLNLTISDDTGLKYYKITYIDGENDKVLESEVLTTPLKNIELSLEAPKLGIFYKKEKVKLIVEVTDISKWNFFQGNSTTKEIELIIDNTKPVANVVANTYAIVRGGSGVVVVEVKDNNLSDMYITFNDKTRFELTPFYKENFYIALIAWPMDIENFGQISLVAKDLANNTTITKVPFFYRESKFRSSNLNISDEFIEQISTEVLTNSNKPIDNDLRARFLRANLELRGENVATIRRVGVSSMDTQMVSSFDITPFKRLHNSQTVAGYGDRRSYFYQEQQIDEQWHLGVDWASVKQAPIYNTNSGKVVFKDYLGIYGNSIIIEHGLGLATLYAHTSSSGVDVGDDIAANTHIANTGATGAVFGDHLHFGVLVQGIEVNPLEWMDKNWIKTRIFDIIQSSKKAIDNK
ncbi:MAG: M23 family metallopeptidase [Arcobacter butzleri]|jgi:murein DD-endopeptidase MepM/ murein hydrolase activator NlpD|nr:peptidoglycan DD-metalloendopeptidase family protein [Arcobacteraceae bacterium]NLO16756.1 M23 family metallopeptidase [Aliarcobacter butzleri]